MLSSRKSKGGKQLVPEYNSLDDVERMVNLMLMEAKTSLSMAGRIMSKLIIVSGFGFVLASNCCLSQYLVPLGILILAMSAGWLDAIGKECSCHRFFPYKTLNSMGASLFRWQWVVFWTCVLYALSLTGVVHFLQFSSQERLWKVSVMAVLPLALMLLGKTIEPFQFRHARGNVEKAEIIVRQLAATKSASDVGAFPPLVQAEQVPLYKLGSIAKMLYDFAATHDAADKLKVDLSLSHAAQSRGPCQRFLSLVYSPFRRMASELLLWESRDLVIYIVAAVYMALVYVGSFYLPDNALVLYCVMVPFFGPKSKAGRYARALQENIRLAQGAVAEKKGGCTPANEVQDNSSIINWPMVVYLGGSHVAAFYAVVVCLAFGGICPLFGNGSAVKFETYIMAAILYWCSGTGITAGVHRLWAHRSYKAGLPLRFVLMIFNSIANQGSIYHWSRDHRLHHKYSDTIADPHDANRGFWFSHVGWLLVKKNKAVYEAGKTIDMSDLKKDPLVMFQKRADPFWNLAWCFALPSFLALQWGDTMWNGFLVGGAFRYVFVLNATWAVNSVVHAWGNRPYNPSHLTTENGWVSLVALGEGWHNWHHAFSWDYAAAELGPWLQFNPTKIFIDTMALLGLAWDRKRADTVWAQRKSRWEQSQGRPVLESLEGPPLFKHRVVTFGPETYGEDDRDDQALNDETPVDAAVEQVTEAVKEEIPLPVDEK